MASCNQPAKYELVIENVGFFNGVEDKGIVNIAINSDTIAAVSTEPLLSDSTIDGADKYLIPGLINSHTHIWRAEDLKAGYEVGILANIGTHASDEKRDSLIKEKSKEEGYPFYYTSGIAATVPGGHPTQVSPNPIETINDTVSVKEFVDHRIANGADFIKIVREDHDFFIFPAQPTLSYDQIEKIIDYTHSLGYKAVVHIGMLSEMVKIAEFKPDGFVHMWSYSDESKLTDEHLSKIQESGAFVVPTAILIPRGFENAKIRGEKAAEWAKENFISVEETLEGIRRMHQAGIMIVAGTDVGATSTINWDTDLLAELDLYSEAGLSNLEVLKTATGNAAKAWDIPVGRLGVGSKANMVLLNGNPLENLEALKDINKIWKATLAED
ncbi:amidohydrolase family protein [Aliifodinibius salicampi]|uniref:Amidohydrolase family protein n=1 Tax=Fodinibius salicampi TaxID=1920655 RepID=A0ABT3PXA8_9BACT|nr:amidohydrolase family protein [Fodinibius salicampi]MCW9712457.1 amidohydrolase family protein [Fodinibius salicampi]